MCLPRRYWSASMNGRVLSQILRGGYLEYDRWKRVRRNSTMIEFKGGHFERDVILWGVRWCVTYPISYR